LSKKPRLSIRLFVACVGAALLAAATTVPGGERKFLSGYAGTLPSRDDDKAGFYFQKPAVRGLLAKLETAPLPRSEAEESLRESGATVNDLLRARILREDGGRLAIGFAYFTAADMVRIHELADRVSPSLAKAYRARKRDFDRIVDSYPPKSVPRGEIEFALLAGFCLNWDGLKVTQDLGLRRPLLVEGKDFRYSFWASEAVPGRDYREFYWGSSTFPLPAAGRADAYSFSSFGDPDSDPRMNFPDLPYLPAGDLAASVRRAAGNVGLRDVDEMGRHFEQVLGGAVFDPVARILFALREKPRPESELAAAAGRDPSALLALLEEIQYVERGPDGAWRLLVPVFDAGDRAMLERTIALSRDILRSWLRERYPAIRRDLSDLTAVRAGLPFEALFTQIWHEIFGEVTRDLARDGTIESAYDRSRRYPGSLSVLWRPSLYAFTPG
jgi:hypothetical protein